MSTFSPSYLFKNRFGKYYFRCRIPINIRKKYNIQKVEVRKSLGTGNRTEALRLSRILWVEMEKNDYRLIDFEADKDRYDRLLREGRPLYEELVLLESKSNYIPSDTEEFFDWLSPFQKEAVAVYKEYISKRNISQTAPEPEKPTNGKEIHTTDLAEKITEQIQKLGKKNLTKILVTDAFEKYLPLATKLNDWKETYQRKVNTDNQLFINVINDRGVELCSEISIEDIIAYRDIVTQLPTRYDVSPKYRDKSYSEIIKLEIPEEKIQSPKTIKNKINNVLAFLRWCDETNYVDVDFEKPLKSVKKAKGKKSNRVTYTPDELNRLFNSKQYMQGTHKSPAHHWIPLIGLFTGARLNEICQLHKRNVVKDSLSGIWYFDFNDYSTDKSKKSDAGLRFVPIHKTLRKLGFFKYFESIEDGGRLFPMLTKSDGSYIRPISKWFNVTYKNKNNCNIEIPDGIKKDFHSFRNTLINAIKQAGFTVESAREIAGHEDESLTFGGYADPLDLPNRKKIVDKVKYPSIDWNLIRDRKWR